MKKTYIIVTLFIATLFVSSCTTSYNDFDAERGAAIGFTLGAALELPFSSSGQVINFPIPYFVSDISSSDRTFQIIIEESEVASENYSIETTVVVPANERSGTVVFTGTNVSLTPEFQTLVLAFEATDGVTSGKRATIRLRSN